MLLQEYCKIKYGKDVGAILKRGIRAALQYLDEKHAYKRGYQTLQKAQYNIAVYTASI